MREHQRRETGMGPPTIGVARHGLQRPAANPVPGSLIAKRRAPPAGPSGLAPAVDTIGDRAGTRDQDDALAHGVTTLPQRHAPYQCDQCVVHDQRAFAKSEAPHDAANHLAVAVAVDPGQAEANRGRRAAVPFAGEVDDVVQDLLDLELAVRLEIGAAGAAFTEHHAIRIREKRHGLGAPGVDAQHMHPSSLPPERRRLPGSRHAKLMCCPCSAPLPPWWRAPPSG